ncbi:asparaginyl-tRNA synthetase [Pseudovirgaria hyperparasitica]|uniref:asparagine--tRNA ligase n=1 Tax=Pseudovirgaria hyperparasitica TaxID=470096 RepID=A0A6A6WB73_9PEZI|nr:asparaginyl-tRNA synthetase [Pseudovirgaria hyperparasitica]KAF2760092.1 asparaginyl-tRNA synthetase [Pseudovirgaria hyperparasitica]
MADKTYYVDETVGKDESATEGTQLLPFRTVQAAYLKFGDTANYLVRKATEVAENAAESAPADWQPAAKTALKNAKKYAEQLKKKEAKEKEQLEKKAKEDSERAKVLEEAKKVVITEDPSLPKAIKIKLHEKDPASIQLRKFGDSSDTNRGTRVRVFGRVHRERKQKDIIFITLRDGYGQLQCIINAPLSKTYDMLTLTRETSIEVLGEMCEVPKGNNAPDDRELQVDFFKIEPEWKAAGGEDAITNRVSADTEHATLLNLRHLTLRGDTASSVMLVRDTVEFAFNQVYRELKIRKVSPPAMVQTQVEGGATLFKFDYYGEPAFLTQSSQLYLETCLPSMGDVYCIEKSFRAEKSLTRRHLSEYTHVEAELDFITFDDLLEHLEHVMCRVLEVTLADADTAAHIKKLNPDFKMPERPFMRMRYSDAIQWLIEHDIPNEDGEPHKIGDDIAEAAERKMTDIINRPIFLTHFPVEIKAFYMMKDKEDKTITESVDCLMPGVGEIVGGSMRIYDLKELSEAFIREEIDPTEYYWYTDQRKYGSSPHGGYGLGLERFLAWLCNQHTVRDTCLYPRYFKRCKP